MGNFGTFLIIAALALQIQSVLSKPKCKNPTGPLGTIISSGCYQRTCEKSGRKAVWKESFSSLTCCSYQRKEYKIGATIETIIADDGCTKVNLVCAQKGGAADIELKVDNDCAQPASERSMLEQFGMVKDILAEILNNTEECCNGCPPNTTADYDLLFLGPGYPLTQGLSEVLNLPWLTPSTCIPPPHPQPKMVGGVGTVWKEGTLLCGGYTNEGYYLDTCYRLKMITSTSGSWISFPPMLLYRSVSAAAMLGNDWWVTGGYSDSRLQASLASTELLSPSDTWSSGVDLPEPNSGHCLMNIDSTRLFLCGGLTNSGKTGATYIYTQGGGFAMQPSMAIARYYQGCALYNDAIWVAGGNRGTTSVEVFSLTSLTWSSGPSLPVPTVGGDLLVINGKLVLIGGNNNNNQNIYQLQSTAWVDVGTLNQTRSSFTALKWNTCTNN